ncbi:MAG TPA: 50S ribosomal protein L9 [Aggregatilineaceae bacterium]|nr:50S ribosomal protein L9 [Aggregatilineaceae bacterium]
MKVILKDYVYKHGVAGDVVTVADGFARNYLFPRGLAVKATPSAVRENQHLIVQAAKNRERLRAMESEAAAKIDGVELVFGVKAGKNDKLYGSITTSDIGRALLEKTGVDINRRRISDRSLRELGVHEVPVRLAHEISPVLRIVILREEEVAPYLEGKPVATLIEQQQRQMEVVEVEVEEEEEIEPEAELFSEEPTTAEEEAE